MRKLAAVGVSSLAVTLGLLAGAEVATSDNGRLCPNGYPQTATPHYRDEYNPQVHFATPEEAQEAAGGTSRGMTVREVETPRYDPDQVRRYEYIKNGVRTGAQTFTRTPHGWALSKSEACPS